MIRDPDCVESDRCEIDGLALLPVETTFAFPKIVQPISGRHVESGAVVTGYHVRMGRTSVDKHVQPFLEIMTDNLSNTRDEGVSLQGGRVFGTYLHGLFDQAEFRRWWLNRLRASKGWGALPETQAASLDARLDRLADMVERHLSMPLVDRLVEAGMR